MRFNNNNNNITEKYLPIPTYRIIVITLFYIKPLYTISIMIVIQNIGLGTLLPYTRLGGSQTSYT